MRDLNVEAVEALCEKWLPGARAAAKPTADDRRLIAALEESGSCNSLRLAKDMGETQIVGQELTQAPSWQWPAR